MNDIQNFRKRLERNVIQKLSSNGKPRLQSRKIKNFHFYLNFPILIQYISKTFGANKSKIDDVQNLRKGRKRTSFRNKQSRTPMDAMEKSLKFSF